MTHAQLVVLRRLVTAVIQGIAALRAAGYTVTADGLERALGEFNKEFKEVA